MKAGRTGLLFCAAAVFLCACQATEKEPWVPDRTAIQAAEDGTITETLIDTLDRDYYSTGELENMIRSETDEYNRKAGSSAVTLQDFTAEGNSVHIVLTYAGAEDYAAFNRVPFFQGSMLGAQMEGFRFETDFLKVGSDGMVSGMRISSEEPVSHKEYFVLVSDREHAVEVPGEVTYVSAPAMVTDGHIVTPLTDADEMEAAEGEGEETAVSGRTGDDGLLYVIYK